LVLAKGKTSYLPAACPTAGKNADVVQAGREDTDKTLGQGPRKRPGARGSDGCS